MSIDRERQFLELVKEFPDSPMGHFSLGKHYLDLGRYPESVKALEEAVRLDPDYAAALVALGDAHAGRGDTAKAREVYDKARASPHGRRDANLIDDIDQRVSQLDNG